LNTIAGANGAVDIAGLHRHNGFGKTSGSSAMGRKPKSPPSRFDCPEEFTYGSLIKRHFSAFYFIEQWVAFAFASLTCCTVGTHQEELIYFQLDNLFQPYHAPVENCDRVQHLWG